MLCSEYTMLRVYYVIEEEVEEALARLVGFC
jgi:hypothetical protein